MHRLLFWYIITSVLTRHRAFARTYFVDPSCPDRVSTVAIPEAITLASEAFTFSDAAFKKVIGRIFPAINDDQITLLYSKLFFPAEHGVYAAGFVSLLQPTNNGYKADLSQIANLQRDTALSVTTNIIFYCDNDARWQVATDDQIPGNSARAADAKAWFDGANDLYHDLKKDGRDATTETRALPGCRAGDGTRAQTYVNRDTFAGPTLSRVGITICSSAYTDVTGALLPYLALQEIPEGTNLASRQNGVKPIIDTYRLVSVTVLHEVRRYTSFLSERLPGELTQY
jgi:hypothetical protein